MNRRDNKIVPIMNPIYLIYKRFPVLAQLVLKDVLEPLLDLAPAPVVPTAFQGL